VTAEGPEVSVVVATYNRSGMVEQTIAAVLAQEGVGDFEIVVVDDGSPDDTWERLVRLASSTEKLVPVRLAQNSGAAAARNAGWRAGRGTLIAFTDDDCTPDAGWLAALCARAGDADIVQGRTVPRPDQLANHGPFGRTMQVDWEEGYYETCNVLYRREWLERLQGFDESFRYPYGEDTDLAWRAKELGAKTVFVDDAIVLHEIWPSRYRAYLRDIRRREGMVMLFSKHPDLRGHIGMGVLYRPGHLESVMAAAGLGLLAADVRSPTRWAIAAGLGARYAWACRKARHRPHRKVDWIAVVPLTFFADLYDTAVMARASIKYRTLLL
jgi:glycosyltransferase involved in cell wall biosynthesis